MKYSVSKRVNKKSLAELFMMLSDSLEESIPDIVWEGGEFELNISEEEVNCDIDLISAKKGGEITLKISWITLAAKKQKAAEAAKASKEKLELKTQTDKAKKAPVKIKESKSSEESEGAEDEHESWSEDEEDWEGDEDGDDWEDEDFDEEW